MRMILNRLSSGLTLCLSLLLFACTSPRVEGRWVNVQPIWSAEPGQVVLDLGEDGYGTVQLADGLDFGWFSAFERFRFQVAGSTIRLRELGAMDDEVPIRFWVRGDTLTVRFPEAEQEVDDGIETTTIGSPESVWVREKPATIAPGE